MRIQHNIMAMNSYRNYSNNTSALSKNLEKLSSGYKINRAGDDAAGLAISEKMRAQITGLTQAQANAKSGINLVQTAEGALTEVHDMLNRMVKLADQSANGTYDDDVDRANLQKEVTQLQSEIDRIADSSNFNGIKLLDGSLGTYKQKTDIAAVAGAAEKNPMTVVGGKLQDGDGVKLKQTAADGKVDIDEITVGGVTIAKADLATKGLKAEVVAPQDAEGKDAIAGTWTIKITVDKKTTATADIAEAIGDGLTVKMEALGGKPGADATYDFKTTGEGGGLTLQIGDTSDSFNKLTVNVQDMHTKALGIDAASISIASQGKASTAVDAIKKAINTVSSVRGDLGATQNRLDHTINNLSVMTENIQDAESTIRDTDVAEEMMAYTKNNILVQSAQAMLAQANQVPQGVLQLLQ